MTARRSGADGSLEVLYEDNHLLVVNKPAGLAVMGGTGQSTSLVDLARRYVKHRYEKPGNVYLGIVSRLDAAVSGALVLARTSKAAARLNAQFRGREVDKLYWAVVAGRVAGQWHDCHDWLIKDEAQRRMKVCDSGVPGAQVARLRYRALRSLEARAAEERTLIEIELETGRKHQIRVQLAARDHAIVGDTKYGSRQPWGQGIVLHAHRLALTHPTRKERMEFVAPLPASWRRLGIDAEP